MKTLWAASVLAVLRRREPQVAHVWMLPGLAAALVVALVSALTVGPLSMSPGEVLASLLQPLGLELSWQPAAHEAATVWHIRLPRAVLAMLVGAALAVSGAALQGLLRTPLAEPGLLGVSSGAALAAVLVIVLGEAAPSAWPVAPAHLLPFAAFAGGGLAVWLVWRIARVDDGASVATLLLAGIAVNAVAGAGIGFLSFVADDQALRSLMFWTLGSLGKAGWDQILVALPFMLLPALFLARWARALNLLLLGEAEAGHLGLDVARLKRWLLVCVTAATGAAVALAGVIGFVGLVVPHLLRLAFGPDHRALLPGAALGGAVLMLAADALARTVLAPAELPVGILTTLLGGPFFLGLLIRYRRQAGIW